MTNPLRTARPWSELLGEVHIALAEPWIDDALCAQVDPELFFPEEGGSTREAKQVCAACEVRAECLQWAMDNNERFGIHGGLSVKERDRIRRDRQAPYVLTGKAAAS